MAAFSFFLFFLSGFAALLYQVVWQRMLALFCGVDVYSATITVTAFMGGLGVGSLAGGYAADRLSPRASLVAFAAAELAISLFALASKWLYYDVLYLRFADVLASRLLAGGILFVSLLWPTFFMGVSLPLLSRALTRHIDRAASIVGALYGVNTLGAATGALVTLWFFMRALGLEASLVVGAVLNAVCALGGLLVFSRSRTASREVEASSRGALSPGAPGVPPSSWQRKQKDFGEPRRSLGEGGEPQGMNEKDPRASVLRLSFRAWAALYALSGFIALSLEIVWFRLLGVMLKSTAFTFGTLLGIYLAGLAAGTLLGIPVARLCRRPDRTFFALQAGVSVYAGAALTVFVNRLDDWRGLRKLWFYFGSYDPIRISILDTAAPSNELGFFAVLYFVLPLVLIGPPTLLMGLSFPLLQKVVQTRAPELGRRVGWLQTANIVGSMTGAALTGCLLLRYLGTAGTLRVLVAAGAVYAYFWCGRSLTRRVAAAAAAVLVLALMPSAPRLWAKLHGSAPNNILFAEDETGLSLIRNQSAHFPRNVFVRSTVFANGLGQSVLPFGGTHSNLGFVPAMLHPRPEDVAVIGLGSGDTLFFAGGRPETRSITCVEIIAPQIETLSLRNAKQRYGGLESILTDPRIRYVFTDGRSLLLREKKAYDIIEADALRHTSAYSGNLYSYEYFTSMAARLKPGGFVVSWAPTERVVRTFVKAFPYVAHYDSLGVLIGSQSPIDADAGKARARLREPFTVAYYQKLGIDLEDLFARTLGRKPPAEPRYIPNGLEDVNTDLYPRDEYLVPTPIPR